MLLLLFRDRKNEEKICTYLCMLNLFLSNMVYAGDNNIVNVQNKISKIFLIMCGRNEFSGNILIAVHNRIIFEKSCGFANRSFHIPNNFKTKFNLGSIGKLFTSISIAQLVQENKLSLDTKAYKIIPSWLPNEDDKNIVVEELLIHASGLGNFMDDNRWKLGADSALYINVNDYKPLILEDKRLFKPGLSQSYSNNGYLLLGAIIESLSHQSYASYLQKNIFDVAKMKDSGIWRLDEVIPNRAEGYFNICNHEKCQWRNNNFEAAFAGSPAGGTYSTIEDLFRFSQALHTNKFMNSTLTKDIFSEKITSVGDIKQQPYKIGSVDIIENFSPYGFAGAWNKYGFSVWEKPYLIGHTGGIKGASAFFATSPDGKYTIIILSNIDGSGPIKLYQKIREALGWSEKIKNY